MSASIADNPVPTDFENYLPWACRRLNVSKEINVTRIISNNLGQTGTAKSKKSKIEGHSNDVETNETKEYDQQNGPKRNDQIAIWTTYDIKGNLNELKFDKNVEIPRKVLTIIMLIVKFHTSLTSIVINSGLNRSSLQELSKLIHVSNITDLCLDNTILRSGNFAVLLEMETQIKQLSLARCRINDQELKQITSKLPHSLPASNNLLLLNLTSNKITDEGAKYIAEMLRSNRKLLYLNLSDNLLTDTGCSSILEVLEEFILTEEEIRSFKARKLSFLNKQQEEMSQLAAEREDRMSVKPKRSVKSAIYFHKVKVQVKSQVIECVSSFHDFNDPFSFNNIEVRDSVVFCYGNNILAYLNLSYNYISYISVKKLLSVLLNQKAMARKPIGLVNVRLDGNRIPINCEEFTQIDSLLQPVIPPVSKSKASKPRHSVANMMLLK